MNLFSSRLFIHTNEKSAKKLSYSIPIESVYEPIQAVWRDDMELIGGISHLATLIDSVRASEEISF